jgi:hypothetical protein
MALSLVADCGFFSVESTAVIAGCKISYPNGKRQLNLACYGCFIFSPHFDINPELSHIIRFMNILIHQKLVGNQIRIFMIIKT